MEIHVVVQGDTLTKISQKYDVSIQRLISENGIANPDQLVIGQSLIITHPARTHMVAENETLYSIAVQYDMTVAELLQNNPRIMENTFIYPGETLVISFTDQKVGRISVNGYVYPNVNRQVLQRELPYLTYLSIFGYGFTESGDLVPVDDEEIIRICYDYGVAPVFVLTTLTEAGTFSNTMASQMFHSRELQDRLLDNILEVMNQKGYRVLDIDFEFILPEDREVFAEFISYARMRLNPFGYLVTVAAAPKVSSDQQGMLYEAHDYGALGEAANAVLLMTYEWGYTSVRI